jgi:3'-phosphoadenosine 5'-phosphosulfate sulfotransferase (PAPS reductase)/FAD synthetase
MTIPNEVTDFLQKGAVLAISISGGKDSQALLKSVMDWYRSENLSNKVFAIHSDLGEMEWEQTSEFVEKTCKDLNVELVVVRSEIDFLDRIENRRIQLEGQNKPHFPSFKQRYCTSTMKIDPINKYLKQFDYVISIEGIRWAESKARATKPRVAKRDGMKRKAITWNAICDFTIEDVWGTYNQSQDTYKEAQKLYRLTNEVPEWWNFHPAYAMGNQRLSCAVCVLANKNDLVNGVKHNPKLAEKIAESEKKSGFSFTQSTNIGKLIESILQPQNTLF